MEPHEIIGKDVKDATIDDLEQLSAIELMSLFRSLDAPPFSEMKGEYETKIIKKGFAGLFGEFYVHRIMGPGRWEGDAFYPFEESSGWGYNKFRKKEKGKNKIIRALRMNTYIGKSVYDDKDSFHVDYSPYCKGLNHSMKDEIRKVNERLFLGAAYFGWAGGKRNSGFFLVFGEAGDWVGPDEGN